LAIEAARKSVKRQEITWVERKLKGEQWRMNRNKEEVEKIKCCEFGKGRENGSKESNKVGREHR
jgi:hypothetical protein